VSAGPPFLAARSLVDDGDRSRQSPYPLQDPVVTGRQLLLKQLAGHAIDRRSRDGTGVDNEPNTRTLSEHAASTTVG
jgi:hypothetical protein